MCIMWYVQANTTSIVKYINPQNSLYCNLNWFENTSYRAIMIEIITILAISSLLNATFECSSDFFQGKFVWYGIAL